MRVTELTAYLAPLSLKREIKHASFARNHSVNLFVQCRLADGTVGWGEGVPREYVTGETPESCLQMYAATEFGDALSNHASDWPDAIKMCDQLCFPVTGTDPRGCGANSLRCAVELSVLDAYGKCFGNPMHSVIDHLANATDIHEDRTRVRYSTTITSDGASAERWSAIKMRVYGFGQCKIKVGVPGQDDVARVARIRNWIGRGVDLRLDANEAWRPEEVIEKMRPLKQSHITCIEQPVAHADVNSLASLRESIGVPVMLDESLCGEIDAQHAIEHRTCDLFNLRLSKCGGYLSCLRMAALARSAGLGYQLGCHPGESGILSAAGRHFASSVRNIRYLEGSYDRHLLQTMPTREDITFGYGGWAPSISKPGLGVTIDPVWMKQNATHQHSVSIG